MCGWLLLFIATASAQPTITSIEIFGNSYFSQRQLSEKIPVRIGSPAASIDQLPHMLMDLYHGEGFYSFTIDSLAKDFSEDSTSVRIRLYIRENVRTLIAAVSVSGNRAFPSELLLSMVETSPGNPLQPALVESDIQAILDYYSRNGFPFVSVSSDSIRVDKQDSSKLAVVLTIHEGGKVYVDEITVEGNGTTSSGVIVREAGIVSGELFNERKLEQFRRRLERLQLFSSVGDPQLYILSKSSGDTLRGGITISVKEGSANTFDGIVGYVPAVPPKTDGYFTGNIFVAMRNLFGTGRKALVRWQRENEITQELELQYKEPWLFGYPVNLGGTFFQRKQDSSYVKTRFDVRGDFILSDVLTVVGSILSESVYPSSSLTQFSVFESNTFSYAGEILYDTRDNLRNPTEGVRYSTMAQLGTKHITGPQQYLSPVTEKDFAIRKYSVDAEVYATLFVRQVMMIGLHGKQVNSSQLELSDLYPFGGTTSLRGYRESQFFASQIAYINTEYRFLTGRASSFFGFIDAGYFSRPADQRKGIVHQGKSLYGYGLGARIETGLGILNVSYALGEGDSFSNGKIHVGLINEF